jgi:hypothetical protein
MKEEKNCLDCVNSITPQCPQKDHELFNKGQDSSEGDTLHGSDIDILAQLAKECPVFKPVG